MTQPYNTALQWDKYRYRIWLAIFMLLLGSLLLSEVYSTPFADTIVPLLLLKLGLILCLALATMAFVFLSNAILDAKQQTLQLTDYQLIKQRKKIASQKKTIAKEQSRRQQLLQNLLPKAAIQELATQGYTTPQSYTSVSILFASFRDFTKTTASMPAKELANCLDYCFSAFDDIILKYGLEKIKTTGGTYMVAGGICPQQPAHAEAIVRAALAMQEFINEWNSERQQAGYKAWEINMGIHTGPVIAGVVGKHKFSYDIWGETVAIAQHLASTKQVIGTHLSKETYYLVKRHFDCVCQPTIALDGEDPIEQYMLKGVLPTAKNSLPVQLL